MIKLKPLSTRSGCKVGWEYYATLDEAKLAAALAVEKASAMEAKGYDWGYQCPGAIRPMLDGTYEVCVP